MDFLQRGPNSNQNVSEAASVHHAKGGRGRKRPSGVIGWITALLLLSVTVLMVALLIKVVTGSPKSETSYVKDEQLQAVFLNNGQVYFGNISSLNDKYVRLSNIYYLRVNQPVQPKQSNSNDTNNANANDVSLVKLGCELHGPDDQMLINRSQVTFWENLKTDGQVAKAVAQYVKDNPDGQKCTTNSNNSSNSNSNSNQ